MLRINTRTRDFLWNVNHDFLDSTSEWLGETESIRGEKDER